MKLGFIQPGATDYQYLTTPKSSQVVGYVLNRLSWSGVSNGLLDSGWISALAGYQHVVLVVSPLVGAGTGGSGQTTSPLDPAGAANPTTMTLADVTAGVWDSLFAQGFAIIAAAYPNATLRIGDEIYGLDFYPWAGPTPGAAMKAAYQHLVTLARAASAGFTFEWAGGMDLSTAGGYSFTDIQNYYPGDAYVDYIGGDIFDTLTGSTGQDGFNLWITRTAQVLPFAKAHGKPYTVSSWSLYNIAQNGHGNDDDWSWIAAAHDWFRANAGAIAWTMYFQNSPGWLGCLQDNPQSEGVFKALFGAWAQELAGNCRPRFAQSGFGPAGAVSPVGSLVHAKATALKTLAVSPSAVGNVLVLSILNISYVGSVSSVTGGGCATWTKITQSNPSLAASDTELWYGTVTTAGPATITAASTQAGDTILGCQEFTIGTPATWAVDASGFSTATSSDTSGTYPSVTPAGINELFVGTGKFAGGTLGGTATGFNYKTSTSGGFEPGAQFVYSTSPASGVAQAPPWSQGSGVWSAVSALLTATPVTPGGGAHRQRLH